MGKIYDAIVVGGGQAGLAAGYYLKKNKLQYLILDSSNQARDHGQIIMTVSNYFHLLLSHHCQD